jgi:hypothetical protein
MIELNRTEARIVRDRLKNYLKSLLIDIPEVTDKEIKTRMNKEVDDTLKALSFL